MFTSIEGNNCLLLHKHPICSYFMSLFLMKNLEFKSNVFTIYIPVNVINIRYLYSLITY
jgi:hypothetical protein